MRLKITLSYLGADFYGWQRQADKPTVQAAVEFALNKIYGTEIAVTGSGRTDEGVHAYGQVAHFDVPHDKITTDKLIPALNYYLPPTVRVYACEVAAENFDARKSAVSKTYFYDFYIGAENPLLLNRAFKLSDNVDINKLKAAAKIFIGKHDFTAFRCKGSSALVPVRTVTECKVCEVSLYGSKGLRLTVSADGFLYKMVRIIAGSLIKAGEGKLTPKQLKELLDSGKEWANKVPAEGYGLYLHRVTH